MSVRSKKLGPLPVLGVALFSILSGCAVGSLNWSPHASVAPGPGSWATGADRAETDGPFLRVLLKVGGRSLKISAMGGLRLCTADGAVLADIPSAGHAHLGAQSGRLVVNGEVLDEAQAQILPLTSEDEVQVSGRSYRGRLLLQAGGSTLALVNLVGLEDYLRGVLPSEVSPRGPAEALKAQAVAARSFALVQMRNSAAKAWDLDNSADSQVYGARDVETPATDAAIRSTRGEILVWHGAVASTFFHSNSGGFTADAAEVWKGANSPSYLLGVLDTWSENQRHYTWSLMMPAQEAEIRLQTAKLWSGHLADIIPGGRSDSERWTKIELLDGLGRRVTISANDFRRALGADRLRSTRFHVELQGKVFVFQGQGWGHGVGLAQEGAFAMAHSGKDYRSILSFYYPGTDLATLKEVP